MDSSDEILGIPRKFVDLSEQVHKIVRKILGIPRKFMDLSAEILGIPRKFVDLSEQVHKIVRKNPRNSWEIIITHPSRTSVIASHYLRVRR